MASPTEVLWPLTGWGRTSPSFARVVSVTSRAELVEAVKSESERGVIARGLGRSYGDVAQNGGGRVLDMTALNSVRSFDRGQGTITVEAGCTIEQLIATALPKGWFVPVVPGTSHVTVGGAVACDVHGKNHHCDGSFGDHVSSLLLLTTDGVLRQLTPNESSEEFWATVGGLGLTGVIVEVTLQLLPVDSDAMSVDVGRAANLQEALDRLEREDGLYRYSVAWVDALARGRSFGRSVLIRGNHASGGARTSGGPPRLRGASVPQWVPAGPILRSRAMWAFNEIYFRRAREIRAALRPLGSFFFPLDVVGSWNRMYGARGFLQYQFVVPFGREDVVEAALDRLAPPSAHPTLVVLKRLGESHGFLSFASPGWTLAVDLALPSPGLGKTLDDLDRLVADAGGRVYFAKDSRLRPEYVERMYGQLGTWRAVRDRLDPRHRLQSDLARRLRLVPPPT